MSGRGFNRDSFGDWAKTWYEAYGWRPCEWSGREFLSHRYGPGCGPAGLSWGTDELAFEGFM